MTQSLLDVPLKVQEALYPGGIGGIARTADPLTVGLPLPDDPETGAADTTRLTLSGAPAGQFRVLGRWPSGRIKWLLVDTQVSVSAGGINDSIRLTGGGAGNFGGPDLASDRGSAITVATGSATFTIRKARFNVIDEAVVGSTTIVASGTSQGLVVIGPPPGQTTCGNCSTPYSSANDPETSVVIEENGPVKAVIRASGSHKDAAGNGYMRFTTRMYFYKGKSFVKVTATLRNADYGGTNSFETAYKGHRGYELRLRGNVAGTRTYSIGTHGAPATGTLADNDSVYLYQAQSQHMRWQDWCGFGCIPYTTDTGYRIVKNGAEVATGNETQVPQGWATLSGSNGASLSIGLYQLAAYWPKSLEFNAGADVRIGIWPRQNSQPYYQAWPQWSTHDLYLNFHASSGTDTANDFLRFQHPLLGRSSIAHYNTTKVFPYSLMPPDAEDAAYRATAASATPALDSSRVCCIQDLGTSTPQWPLNIFRFYTWRAGGGANQAEFRWSSLLNFLTRGMTGRYLNAAHFYRFQADSAWPHSDSFSWRERGAEVDGVGFPRAESANSQLAFRNWLDQEHGHWYGMTDYYFMSGDESIREALLDGPKDYFLNRNTYQNGEGGGLFNTRSIGVQLMGAARFFQFLRAVADPDAPAVLDNATRIYDLQVKPELCVSGFPIGCQAGKVDGGPFNTQGVSRTRGVPWGQAGTSGTWCGAPHAYRVQSAFQPSILIQGLIEFAAQKGESWPDYWEALDLAYGMAQWNLTENFVDSGNGRWDTNGFRFGIALDVPNNCPGESPEPNFQPVPTQTTAMTFFVKHLIEGSTDWASKFRINVQKTAAALGTTTSDFGGYQLALVFDVLNRPPSTTLRNVSLTGFASGGAGSYTLQWTVPPNAVRYRIKWAPRRIVDWVGFDPGNNVFTGDPSQTVPWFAAANVRTIPAPESPGSTQTVTIATGVPGLTSENFSVRVYIGETGVVPPSQPTPPAAPANLRIERSPVTPDGPTGSASAIDWQLQPLTEGMPGYNGWLNLWFDPVSKQTLLYGVRAGSSSIYSTDLFAYSPTTNTWTHIGGTGSMSNDCSPGTPSQPGNRHPVWQMAVDTTRSVLWLFGGVCQGINRKDMYFLRLNQDPRANTWHQVNPGMYPIANSSSAMVHDPENDVLFLFGSDTGSQTHTNWVYCPSGTGSSGSLTANQRSAGCSSPDTWNEITPAGGRQPPGVALPGMVYDPVTKKIVQFGGMTGGGVPQNQTWVYDVPSRTWTRRATSSPAPPVYAGPGVAQPALAYDPRTGKIRYHQTSNSGSPADWEYDVKTDVWTRLQSGSGPTIDLFMAFDSANNMLIGFSRNPESGLPDVWHGIPK